MRSNGAGFVGRDPSFREVGRRSASHCGAPCGPRPAAVASATAAPGTGMAALAVAAAALSLLSAAASSKAAFNLYLKQHESRRLFGEWLHSAAGHGFRFKPESLQWCHESCALGHAFARWMSARSSRFLFSLPVYFSRRNPYCAIHARQKNARLLLAPAKQQRAQLGRDRAGFATTHGAHFQCLFPDGVQPGHPSVRHLLRRLPTFWLEYVLSMRK